MPLTIGTLTAEVIAEPEEQAAAGAAGSEAPDSREMIRAELAALARVALRTRAEGFDD